MIRRPPRSTLFPYPPLFGSAVRHAVEDEPLVAGGGADRLDVGDRVHRAVEGAAVPELVRAALRGGARRAGASQRVARSEEHTSELQSRQYLVCRLLLEKKTK